MGGIALSANYVNASKSVNPLVITKVNVSDCGLLGRSLSQNGSSYQGGFLPHIREESHYPYILLLPTIFLGMKVP
jgi:hypothetical protein